MRSLGEVHLDTLEIDDDEKESVSQIFKNKIIDRAPDKMIDCVGDCILLSYRNQIIYLDVCKYGIDKTQESSKIIEHSINDDELAFVDIDPQYKIIVMQHTGIAEMSSIVLEHLSTRQIRFLRIEAPKSTEG